MENKAATMKFRIRLDVGDGNCQGWIPNVYIVNRW